MKRILAIAAFLGLTTFWACHLGPESSKDTFDVVGDTSWTHCDTLEILLMDDSGRVLDTLYRDPLDNLDDLKDLSADKYQGGKARVQIKGYFENGDICVDQTRSFEAGGTKVKVDTVKDPNASPASVVPDQEFLSLTAEGPSAKVKGHVLPLYADQGIYWSLDSTGAASLDVAADSAVGEVSVKPLALGETFLTLKSRKDPSKTAKVRVRVNASAAQSVTLDNDSLTLYVNGPKDSLKAVVLPHLADATVAWSSADPEVAQVDTAGRVTPGKEGRTVVRAVTANGKRDSAVITVIPDVPNLVVSSKPGAAVNVALAFHAHVTQKVGHLVSYAWDFHGDGTWDDSIPGPFHGDSVRLDSIEAKYSSEGVFTARFRVRDSEGNIGLAERTVDIGNQAPEIMSIRGDTTISVKDSIPMLATVRDLDGKVAWAGWDYEGDGLFDDTLLAADTLVEVVLGHKYHEAGNYLAIFKALDGNGKARLDTARIKVEFDEPVADMGGDTTVIVNSDIPIKVKGTDRFGPIVKRELKVGDGPFVSLSNQDTIIKAPATPAVLTFIGRVTDNDGLTDVDTLKVTVILSANADLANLTVTSGELVPAFKPSTGNYAVQVDFQDSLVRVTPTAKDPAAIITVNAKAVASGAASDAVKLQVGANNNVFQVLVTAPDGSQRTYSVSVARNPNAEATLKNLVGAGFTLKPAFAANILEYVDTVPAATAAIILRPTVASAGATVAIDGEPIASGTPSGPLPLVFGDNAFNVVVTAMDGASTTTYKVRIVRLTKLVIYRKLGSAAAVPADSTQLPLGVSVPISSPGATGFTFSRWSILEGGAAIADSASNPTSLTMSSGLVKVQAAFILNRWTITGSAEGCGSINPPGQVTLDHGTPVNYTITPAAGCRIVSVKIDGVEDSTALDGAYSFGPVTANRTLAATFIRTFVLKSKAGPGGTISPDSVKLDSGKAQEFTIAPAAGKRIQSVKLDGQPDSLAAKRTIIADADHLLEATFIAGYTLTAAIAQGQGTVTPASVGVDSGQGATFTISASANPPYRFLSLTDNGTDMKLPANTTSYSLSAIDKPHALQIRFLRRYNLSVTASGPGSVSGTAGLADSGSSNTFTLAPASGAVIKSLLVDGVATTPPGNNIIAFNGLNADHGIAVTFVKRFTVATTWNTNAVSGGAGGSISPVNPSVDSGAAQVLGVTANAGYRLRSLLVNGGAVTPTSSYTFASVNAAQALHANFWKTFRVTAVSAGGGTVSPADTTVDSAGAATLNFTVASGYRFDRLRCNGQTPKVDFPNPWIINPVGEAQACSVYFMRRYVLTGVAGAGGTISPADITVDSLGRSTFLISPASGFRVDSVFDNGVLVTATGTDLGDKTYELAGISANHTVRATFRRYYDFKTSVSAGGTISPADGWIDQGANLTFTMTASAGFELTGLTDNGVSVIGLVVGNRAGSSQYTLTNVAGGHTVIAAFARRGVLLTAVSNVFRDKEKGIDTVPPVGVAIPLEKIQVIGDSVEVKTLSGNEATIAATATFEACKVCGVLYFQHWNLVSPKGDEKEVGSENPMKIMADDDYKYRAIYSTTRPPRLILGAGQ